MPQRKIVIGIGGTGTKIVHHMTEHWQEFGSGVPDNVRLVAIDAKKTPDRTDLDRQVTFVSVPEPINFEADHAHHMAQRESGVADWWLPEMRPGFNISFTDGCGCHRTFGRYFVFRYAGHIIDVLQRTIDDLFRQRVETRAEAAAAEVWITCSLANGTGGGTFLDIATLLAAMIHQKVGQKQRVVVQGLFIPGSVTRHGSNPDQIRRQISAAGVGALVELQAEFNRVLGEGISDPSGVEALRGARSFTAFLNGQYRTFGTQEDERGSGRPPIDVAYLLERQNLGGWVTEYPRLLKVGADALAGLLDGTDAEDRGLDVLSRVGTHSRRFGSLGYCRLRAPVQEIGAYVTARAADDALTLAAGNTEADLWADLLALRGIGLPATLAPRPGASGTVLVRDSVAFFIGDVLRIRERGEGDASWQDVNDLFDRLAGLDGGAVGSFRDRVQRAQDESDPNVMFGALEDVFSELQRTEQELGASYRDTLHRLVHGRELAPSTLAAARDAGDMETIRGLGIRRLLERVARSFLEAGAFALLGDWMEEFIRQVEQHHASVVDGERALWRVRDDARPHSRVHELQERSTELRTLASGLLHRLFRVGRNELIDQRDGLLSEARNLHGQILNHAKVMAVEALYRDVEALPAPYVSLARSASEALRASAVRREWQQEAADIAARLDRSRQDSSQFHTEILVGSANAATQVARALSADPEAGSLTLLRRAGRTTDGPSGELVAFLRSLQPTAAAALYPDPEGDPVPDGGVDAFAHHLHGIGRSVIYGRLAHHASLENLIRGEARAAFDAWNPYFRTAEEAGSAIARTEYPDHRLIESTMTLVFGANGRQEIENAVRSEDRETLTTAGLTALALRERLRQVVDAATPQWQPSIDIDGRAMISLSAGLKNSALHTVADAFRADRPNERSLSLVPAMNRDVVECVHVAVGASLADLDLAGEIPNYEEGRAWDTIVGQGFSPHTTRDYDTVGARWLRRRFRNAAGRQPRAAGLLALALFEHPSAPGLFGWLARSGASVSWARETPMLRDHNGATLAGGRVFTPGTSLSTGGLHVAVTTLDQAADDRAADALHILAHLLWTDLQAWLTGDEGRTRTPLDDVLQALGAEVARLDTEAEKAGSRDLGHALSAMANQMRQLVADLSTTGGRERPALLREP